MAVAIPFIDAILENDLKAPFNQRHTAHQIWRRIRSQIPKCDIGESTVGRLKWVEVGNRRLLRPQQPG
jgi:hypothetical protein